MPDHLDWIKFFEKRNGILRARCIKRNGWAMVELSTTEQQAGLKTMIPAFFIRKQGSQGKLFFVAWPMMHTESRRCVLTKSGKATDVGERRSFLKSKSGL